MLLYSTKLAFQKESWLLIVGILLWSELGLANQDQLVSISDKNNGIEISSNYRELLNIRVAFVVPLKEPGYVGVCNPYGPFGNRSVPLPGELFSEYDQKLFPGKTLWVPATACPNYVNFSVWVRNAFGELLYQFHSNN